MVRKQTGRRRFAFLLLTMVLLLTLSSAGQGEIKWKTDTPGQAALRVYMETVNRKLMEAGEEPVNRLFELYSSFAVLGITATDDAETPESVEITVRMTYDGLNSLELRVSDASRFPAIAGAFLRALSQDETSSEGAEKNAVELMQRATAHPKNTYEEEIETLNGTSPRVYYAYYPNQYRDGINWLQMTLIFPLTGTWDGQRVINSPAETKAPDTWSDHDPVYEGYDSDDDFQHLEVFVTATPEPGSAARDLDPYYKDE